MGCHAFSPKKQEKKVTLSSRQDRRRRPRSVVVVLTLVASSVIAAVPAAAHTVSTVSGGTVSGGTVSGSTVSASGWPSAGQNDSNTRNAPDETSIGTRTVSRLAPKWTFTTAGDVSATATVVHGTVYVPDWGGQLSAVSAATGRALWTHAIAGYDGISGDVSRTSPAYWHSELVIGTGGSTLPALDGAYIVGISASTGAMLWRTKADPDPAAIITGSPTIYHGVVFVGISSKDEGLSTAPTFRGSVEALSAATGQILWKTYVVPSGYTGGAVWGGQPAVDPRTGMLYIATGNNYSVPADVCDSPVQTGCTPPDAADHFDSILGLNLRTGAVEWAHPTLSADTWTEFEPNAGPDFDFGSSPSLYTTDINGTPTQLLGIGQKSGVYYALNPRTGQTVWETQAGPGGFLGGIEWGAATDGRHIFIAEANSDHQSVTITSYDGQPSTTTGGYFAALDAATGKVDWEVADPQGYLDDSFVSSARGVMYAGSSAPSGTNMYALDADTGAILWSFASGGAVFAGASIVGGTVFWGSGYHTEDLGLGYNGDNDKLYAFTLRGR